MTNKMSSRDKVLMGVLALVVLAAAWYMLFLTPTKNKIAELQTQQQSISEENNVVVEDIKVLKGWMEDLGLSLDDDDEKVTNFTKIADYNNLVNLTDEVNQILGVTETFSMNFSTPERGENCYRRDISVTFKTNSRQDAIDVLRSFNEMEHGCLLNNITFSLGKSEAGDETANVNCNISIFEYEKTEDGSEDTGSAEEAPAA